MAYTHNYSEEQWESWKPRIRQLYIVENYEFKTMRDDLAMNGFSPSKNKFLKMLKHWGFKKYSKGERWRALANELKRKGIDLETSREAEIEIEGRMISRKKLKKELARHASPKLSDNGQLKPALPQGTLPAPQETPTSTQWTFMPITAVSPEANATPPPSRIPTPAGPGAPAPATISLSGSPTPTTPCSDIFRYTSPSGTEATNFFINQSETVRTTTISPDINQPESFALLDLPMLDILQMLLPLFPGRVLVLQKFREETDQRMLLMIYKYLRVLLLGMASSAKRNNDAWEGSQMIETIVISAAMHLCDSFGMNEFHQSDLDVKDIMSSVEAVLPAIDSDINEDVELELFLIETLTMDNIAVVFYVCYLTLNNLIADCALDMFLSCGSKVQAVQQATTAIVSSHSNVAQVLQTKFLHSAIRIGDRTLVKQLLDVNHHQLNFMRVQNSFGRMKSLLVSPLQAAIVLEEVETAQLLIDTDIASVNAFTDACCNEYQNHLLATAPVCLAAQRKRTLHLLPLFITLRVPLHNTGALPHAILSEANWDLINRLIQHGADVNEYIIVEGNETSVVHAASTTSNSEVLRRLLQLGIGPEGMVQSKTPKHKSSCKEKCCTRALRGPTPFMLAITKNRFENAEVLRSFGADTSKVWKESSALTIAINNGSHDIVKSFFRHGMMSAQSVISTLPSIAIRNKDKEMLQLLIEEGEATDATIMEWEQLLFEAVQSEGVDMTRCLIQQCTKYYERSRITLVLDEALLIAAKLGCVKIMKLLLGHGANINAECIATGRSVLEVTAKGKHYAAATFAIGCGATLQNSFDEHQTSNRQRNKNVLLSLAAASGRSQQVVVLLESGAAPNGNEQLNAWIESPLCNAIKHARLDILKALIRFDVELSVKVNTTTFLAGQRCLFPVELAVASNCAEALLELLAHVKQPLFRPAILVELWNLMVSKRVRVKLTLIEAVLNLVPDLELGQDALAWAFFQGSESDSIADLLIQRGAPIDCPSYYLESPLQSSVMHRKFAFAERLVRAYGSPFSNKYHMMALHAACCQGHINTIELLLEVGCDLNLTASGWTALDIAAERGMLSVVRILLYARLKADDNALSLPRTALYHAARNGYVDVFKLLLDSCTGESLPISECKSLQTKAKITHRSIVSRLLEKYRQAHDLTDDV